MYTETSRGRAGGVGGADKQWSVEIPSFFRRREVDKDGDEETHVYYNVVVCDGSYEWEVARRYSDAFKVYRSRAIQEAIESGTIKAEFPSRKFKFLIDEEVLHTRRLQLQYFFNFIPDTLYNSASDALALRHFLAVDSHLEKRSIQDRTLFHFTPTHHDRILAILLDYEHEALFTATGEFHLPAIFTSVRTALDSLSEAKKQYLTLFDSTARLHFVESTKVARYSYLSSLFW